MAMLRFVQTCVQVVYCTVCTRLHLCKPIYTSSFLGTRTLSVGYPSFATMGRGAFPQIQSTPFHCLRLPRLLGGSLGVSKSQSQPILMGRLVSVGILMSFVSISQLKMVYLIQ